MSQYISGGSPLEPAPYIQPQRLTYCPSSTPMFQQPPVAGPQPSYLSLVEMTQMFLGANQQLLGVWSSFAQQPPQSLPRPPLPQQCQCQNQPFANYQMGAGGSVTLTFYGGGPNPTPPGPTGYGTESPFPAFGCPPGPTGYGTESPFPAFGCAPGPTGYGTESPFPAFGYAPGPTGYGTESPFPAFGCPPGPTGYGTESPFPAFGYAPGPTGYPTESPFPAFGYAPGPTGYPTDPPCPAFGYAPGPTGYPTDPPCPTEVPNAGSGANVGNAGNAGTAGSVSPGTAPAAPATGYQTHPPAAPPCGDTPNQGGVPNAGGSPNAGAVTPTAGDTPNQGGVPNAGGSPNAGAVTPTAGDTPNQGGLPNAGGSPNAGAVTPTAGDTPNQGGVPNAGGSPNAGAVTPTAGDTPNEGGLPNVGGSPNQTGAGAVGSGGGVATTGGAPDPGLTDDAPKTGITRPTDLSPEAAAQVLAQARSGVLNSLFGGEGDSVTIEGVSGPGNLKVGTVVDIKNAQGVTQTKTLSQDDVNAVNFRTNLIQAAQLATPSWDFTEKIVEMPKSKLQPPEVRTVTANGSEVQETVLARDKNWEVVERTGTDNKPFQYLQMKEGARASEAIDDIFSNKDKFIFDCATPMHLLNLKAELDTVGPDAFNSANKQLVLHSHFVGNEVGHNFDSGFDLRVTYAQPGNAAGAIPGVEFARYDGSADKLTPGEWRYFQNYGDTSGGASQGTNRVYLGQGDKGQSLWWTIGDGIQSTTLGNPPRMPAGDHIETLTTLQGTPPLATLNSIETTGRA